MSINTKRSFSESALLDPRIRPSARTDARGKAGGTIGRFQRQGTVRSAVRSRTDFAGRKNMFAAGRPAANTFWRRPKTVLLLTA